MVRRKHGKLAREVARESDLRETVGMTRKNRFLPKGLRPGSKTDERQRSANAKEDFSQAALRIVKEAAENK